MNQFSVHSIGAGVGVVRFRVASALTFTEQNEDSF